MARGKHGATDVNAMLSLQRLALPLTFAQLSFAANTFVTSLFLSRSSTTALHASLPGSMLAVAVSSLAISSLGYSGTVFGFLVNMAIAPIFINGLFGVPTSGIRGAGWSATISHIVPCVILSVAIRLRPLERRARQMCRVVRVALNDPKRLNLTLSPPRARHAGAKSTDGHPPDFRKPDANSTISQSRYGRHQPPLSREPTILCVESTNDSDITITHP